MADDSDSPPRAPRTEIDPALLDDAETNLLSSPIERSLVNRAFFIGGPLALLVAIVFSLWVSWSHIRFSAVVQTESHWAQGETRAVRVQVHSERGYDPGRPTVALSLARDAHVVSLPPLQPIGVGIAQGTVEVPSDFGPGLAELTLTIDVEPEPVVETIPITVVSEPVAREPVHVVSSSMAQYADDTEPQPDNVKIDLLAHGRVQTGFDNVFYVRVTDPHGKPWEGPVTVDMLKGELAGRVATPEQPVSLVRGTTDRLGLLSWRGLLISETLRLDVRLTSRSEPDKTIASRKMMLISFAGGVSATVAPPVAAREESVELSVTGLSGKRAIYVDVHDPGGAWIQTFTPPMVGRQPPRPWVLPATLGRGVVQFETYDQLNAPGETTAVVRLHSVQRVDADAQRLTPLLDGAREALSVPRTDETFDEKRERAWLDHVAGMTLSPAEVDTARRWLLGTHPVTIYGAPTALTTRVRDEEALAAFKRRWTIVVRWILLGGGGLFLATMTLMMMRSHAVAAAKTGHELRELSEASERDLVDLQIAREQQAALLRGLGLVAVMASALVLAVLMLEHMVWEF